MELIHTMREGVMIRLLLMFLMVLFLYGCGTTASQSEFIQHPTHFASWDHIKFSLWGYNHPSETYLKESREQGWWGEPIPYIPAE
jgi:hypothetical protein